MSECHPAGKGHRRQQPVNSRAQEALAGGPEKTPLESPNPESQITPLSKEYALNHNTKAPILFLYLMYIPYLRGMGLSGESPVCKPLTARVPLFRILAAGRWTDHLERGKTAAQSEQVQHPGRGGGPATTGL